MKCIRSICIVVISTLFVMSSALANETLLNHVRLTSQAMSAFYMQGLSQGNEKYLREFSRFKKQSETLLKQYVRENGEQGEELLHRWQDFSGELKLEYQKDYGWEVDARVRQDFRAYLSDIYLLVDKQKSSYTSIEDQKLLTMVQVEALSARFFDISSTYNGTESLFSGDMRKFNPQAISKDLNSRLSSLASSSANTSLKNGLAGAQSKWKFVENSVVNYQKKSAYFVVYATKNKIHQVLVQR